MPPIVAVHAADLGHAVKLADLAGQVETGGPRGDDLVPLRAEPRVRPDPLVHRAPLHLRLSTLAPPLLLLIVCGAASAEQDSLETLNPGDLPANSWFLTFENFSFGDFPPLPSTNSLSHLWAVRGTVVEAGLVVAVLAVVDVVAVVVVEVWGLTDVVIVADLVVVVEVEDDRGVRGGGAGVGWSRRGSHIVRQRFTGGGYNGHNGGFDDNEDASDYD